MLGQPDPGRVGQFNGDAMLAQATGNFLHLQINDLNDLLFGQRVENDNLINTIQELRAEVVAQGILNVTFETRVIKSPLVAGLAVLVGLSIIVVRWAEAD